MNLYIFFDLLEWKRYYNNFQEHDFYVIWNCRPFLRCYIVEKKRAGFLNCVKKSCSNTFSPSSFHRFIDSFDTFQILPIQFQTFKGFSRTFTFSKEIMSKGELLAFAHNKEKSLKQTWRKKKPDLSRNVLQIFLLHFLLYRSRQ